MTLKNMPKRFKNIILIGMPASGKSTFGKSYALFSGRFFLDFDKFIEHTTRKKISSIFQKEGEEGFRQIEDSILKKLEKKHNYVIAMGGGTLCREENFEFARKLGLIVYLETPVDILSQRIWAEKINKINSRPLFENLNSQEEIKEKLTNLWTDRQDFYEKAYIHMNTVFSSLDNIILQLGHYEKKSAERERFKEKQNFKFKKTGPRNQTAG